MMTETLVVVAPPEEEQAAPTLLQVCLQDALPPAAREREPPSWQDAARGGGPWSGDESRIGMQRGIVKP